MKALLSTTVFKPTIPISAQNVLRGPVEASSAVVVDANDPRCCCVVTCHAGLVASVLFKLSNVTSQCQVFTLRNKTVAMQCNRDTLQ